MSKPVSHRHKIKKGSLGALPLWRMEVPGEIKSWWRRRGFKMCYKWSMGLKIEVQKRRQTCQKRSRNQVDMFNIVQKQNAQNRVTSLPGTYSLHSDWFLWSIDLQEIRAKEVFDPYVRWPFLAPRTGHISSYSVRLNWLLHGSTALTVLFKIGFLRFQTIFLTPKSPQNDRPEKVSKTPQSGSKMMPKRCQNHPWVTQKWSKISPKVTLYWSHFWSKMALYGPR